MRSLIILIVIGVAVASDSLIRNRRHTSGWDKSVGQARIDAQEMRMSQLSDQLSEVEAIVGTGFDGVPDSMVRLEKRLGGMEGNDCPVSRRFSCGRHSGQCCAGLTVCDGVQDCENGFDEDVEYCKNPVPAGRSWSGVATWDSCLVRSNNQFSLLITGNKRFEHFRAKLWVDAVIIESYTVANKKEERTWSCHGSYDYSTRVLTLYPPSGSTSRIGMKCTDSGPSTTQCTFITESGTECGTATLTRGA